MAILLSVDVAFFFKRPGDRSHPHLASESISAPSEISGHVTKLSGAKGKAKGAKLDYN